jgi:retinol dehydrogenase-14
MADTGSMTGKTVLITGGTGGIGKAAAIGLARMGARVGITGHDRARAVDAAAAITRESGNPAVDIFVADMSSQADVRRLAIGVLAIYPRLDVLLNNVGGFWAHRHLTADGLEHTFALNHLAPFLLTNLLLDRLVASSPARVVTVSSGAHSMGKIDFDDLMGQRNYSGSRAYNQSKLANVMFTYELARRLEGTGVTANAMHPGLTSTAFSAEDPALGFLVRIMRPFMRSPAKGADTAIYLASAPDVAGVTGRYFADRVAKETSKPSYDTAAAARLWQVSADLVGLPQSVPIRS